MGPGYMGWGWMGGFPWMMIFFVAMAVLCLILLFRWRGPWGCGPGRDEAPPRETALEILKRRYAAGEITREEFERIRADIT